MKSSTEVLRAMLDERGVEYEPIDSVHSPNRRTLWGKVERGKGIFGLDAKYETIEFKKGMRLTISDCSPEQAIEATLGRVTCQEVKIDRYWRGCGECGYVWEFMYGIGKCERPRYCPNCGRKVRA